MIVQEKKQIIEKFAQHATDTGSPEVQISLITARINQLSEHFKTHKKDFHSKQGLLKLVSRRRGLTKYLQRIDFARYKSLIAALGLRK